MVGQHGAGMRRASSSASSQPIASPARRSPVTPALVASVTWSAPAGQRPGHPGVDGAEGTARRPRPAGDRGRPGRGWRPAWWPTRWAATRKPSAWSVEAGADRAQVLPPEPGRHRHAGRAVPHDGRRPLVGDADGRRPGPPSASAAGGDLEHGGGHGRRRRTRRGRGPGVSGSTATWWTCSTRARRGGPRRPARRRCRRRRRGWLTARATGPNGRGQAELARVEDAVRVEGRLQVDAARRRPAPRASARNRDAVEPDAVVVADGAAGREGGGRGRVPGRAVVALGPGLGAVGAVGAVRGASGEGEVEAGAVGVGVRLVGRGHERPLDARRGRRRTASVEAGQRPTTVPRPRRCRPRCRPATAGRGPRRRCGARATARRGRRRGASAAAALVVDDGHGGVDQGRDRPRRAR